MVLCFVVQCVGIRLHLCVCAQIMILSFATFSIIPVVIGAHSLCGCHFVVLLYHNNNDDDDNDNNK